MVKVTRMMPPTGRAEQLVRQVFLPAAGAGVSRPEALAERGADHADRREWAVAWQTLERAGFICPEPADQSRFFLTSAGVAAAEGDFEAALHRALGL